MKGTVFSDLLVNLQLHCISKKMNINNLNDIVPIVFNKSIPLTTNSNNTRFIGKWKWEKFIQI